jgi:hypothetical protein
MIARNSSMIVRIIVDPLIGARYKHVKGQPPDQFIKKSFMSSLCLLKLHVFLGSLCETS